MKLLMSTGNPNKLIEARDLLEAKGFQVLGLSDLSQDFPEVVEDLETLEGNALKKAREIAKISQMPTFSDDTGLEVDFLDGAPGVYSARYAGPEADAAANRRKMLSEMKESDDRKANFRTVIALVDGIKEFTFHGLCEGSITREERGNAGFGYDPIFLPDGFERTFAEMSLRDKNGISHRAKALRAFAEFLDSYKIES